MPKVFVLYYSTYGHVQTLSRHIKKGLESQGVEVETYQVPETLPEDVLEKMHAPPKSDDPVITVDKLKEADGFMLGIPTRFGSMPAQWKSFLDATGQLWASGALAGKFAGIFFSTASQHGGQESTAWTTITYLAHHGINYVPFGFANTHLFDNSEVVGGSAYGAGTVANGDGSRQPSEKELSIAETQGENFAKLLNTMHKGQGAASQEEIKEEKKEKTSQQDKPKEAPTTTTRAAAAPKPAPKDDEEPKKKNKCFCM